MVGQNPESGVEWKLPLPFYRGEKVSIMPLAYVIGDEPTVEHAVLGRTGSYGGAVPTRSFTGDLKAPEPFFLLYVYTS